MSKNKQILIFSGIGILVLAAIAAVLMLTAPEAEPSQTTDSILGGGEEEDTSVELIDKKAKDVLSVTIKNSDGTYEITPKDGAEELTFTIKDIEKAPLLTDSLMSAVENAASMTANQFVEEATDLSKYGLDKPQATVTVKFSDNTAHSFKVGNVTPNSSTNVYIATDDNKVYTYSKSKVSAYSGNKFSFVDTLAVSDYDSAGGEEVTKLTIERTDLEEPIVIEIIPMAEDEIQVYTYRLTSPYTAYADLADAPTLMYSIFNLQADSVQWVGLEELDYEMAGLNEPTCVITTETNERTVTITLGKALVDTYTDEEGKEVTEIVGFYGTSSEVEDVLFLFNYNDIVAANIMPEQIISNLFLMPYIYSLDSVTYTDKDGRELEFSFETIKGETTVDEEGNTVKGEDIHKHFVNGEEVKDAELLKDMYQYIIAAAGEDLYFEEEKGELLATVVYKYADENEGEDIVRFYSSETDRKIIINLNGENLFKSRQMYITQLFANIDNFYAGEEIVLTY